jgi:hypothetical protein
VTDRPFLADTDSTRTIFPWELDENASVQDRQCRRYSLLICQLSRFICRYSPKAYRFPKQLLSFSSVFRLFLNFNPITRNSEHPLTDSLGISSLVSEWYRTNDLPDDPIEIILGVDVVHVQSDAQIPHVDDRACNNAHYCVSLWMTLNLCFLEVFGF